MARVPIPSAGSGPQLRALPGGRLEVQDQTAGARMIGAALQQSGEDIGRIADQQEQIDQSLDRAAVRKADTAAAQRLRDRLWTGDNAFYKQEGFNAANARDGVEQDIVKLRDELRGGLTTERQRSWFDQAFEQRAGQEREGIARYVTGQVQVEEKRQLQTSIGEHSNDAITWWADPTRREGAIGAAEAAVRTQGAVSGWAPSVVAAAVKETRSNIYTRAIGAMIDRGDVEEAHANLLDASDVLQPDSASKLTAALRGPLLDRQAEGIVDDLLGTAAPVETIAVAGEAKGAVLPRMNAITGMAESGGRERNRDGSRVTSPKGAQGIMQVMPNTQRDPGFGVKASNGTPEDDARVGRDYLAAMMKRYNNDPAKAWAAYNAGPGAVDKALGKGGDWLSNLPAETRAYVRGNLAQLGGRGANAPIQQRPQEHDVTQLLARVDQMNLPFDVEQRVRQRVTQRVGLDEQLLARQREQAQEQAWGTVEKLGDKYTSVNQIPADVRARMSPQQRLQFEAAARQNVNQGGQTNWEAYSKYSDMAGNDPQAFVALNPAEMKAKLSNPDFEQFMGMRRSIQSALSGGRRSPEQVTLSRITGITEPLLSAAGVTRPADPPGSRPRDPKADQEYYGRVGKFQRKMTEDVQVWQERHPGALIDDNTIRDMADRNLIGVWEKDRNGAKQARGFAFETPLTGGKGYDIPNTELQRIRSTYRQRWGHNPTMDEVDEIYRYGARGGR